MEIGACPRCARPYTVSEVTGFGILRARDAAKGGPRVEYGCLSCGRVISLIPYGDGRYAIPGKPPSPRVSEAQRRPPWIADARPGAQAQAQERPPEEPGVRTQPPPEPEPQDLPPPGEEEGPIGLREALELLGCTPASGPDEIKRAFRQRSRLCHPDKVAHLDPEFQELAERKFKRLRSAYDLLLS